MVGEGVTDEVILLYNAAGLEVTVAQSVGVVVTRGRVTTGDSLASLGFEGDGLCDGGGLLLGLRLGLGLLWRRGGGGG